MRLLKWQLLIVVLFLIFSGMNYGYYSHRLSALETDIKSVREESGIAIISHRFTILDVDQARTVREYKSFIDREVILAVICCAGIIILFISKRR
jgi:hypothetical protein